MREQGLGLDAQALYEPNPSLPIERLSALVHQVATREGRAFSRQDCHKPNTHAPLSYQFVLSIYWLNYVFSVLVNSKYWTKGKRNNSLPHI